MSGIKDKVVNEVASNGRIRHVPFYGFQFSCEERAMKRRELKERLYEKELERTTMLTKLKEIEEAEVKMLRKSMVVRANPVPDFYHLRPSPPPSPKFEFDKASPTRAKSQKLGRSPTSPAWGYKDRHCQDEM